MSTLNVSTIIPDAGTNTDLSLDGKGTGKVAIVDDASVGGDVTVAGGSVTMTGTLPTLTIHDDSATTYTEGNDAAAIDFKIRSSDVRTGASIRMFNNSTNGTDMGLTIDTLDGDSAIETLRLQDRDVNVKSGNLLFGTASKGVYLGVTSATAANLLDDYEEGTWTPAVTSSGGSITTVGAVSGSYTKVGRMVTIVFNVTITTNGTGSGQVNVGGVPFASSGIWIGAGREDAATGKLLQCFLANSTSIGVKNYDDSYPGADGRRMYGTVTYSTA